MSDINIDGLPELKSKLRELEKAIVGNMLMNAVQAGGLLIQNAAKQKAPYLSGDLRRSIHMEEVAGTADHAEIAIGPTVPYGRRIEFGFDGADSKGRVYHQQAQPYMRPAVDEHGDAALQEVGEAFAELIKKAAR